MKKEIIEMEGRIVVYIKDEDDSIILVQPFDPRTGKAFENEEVANQWADEMIALMMPAEEAEGTEETEKTEGTEETTTEG